MIAKLFLVLICFAMLLCAIYFFLILSYCYGWLKTKQIPVDPSVSIFVSVIIAARNEEKNIANCLNAIANQSYAADKIEVIIADDHSEDNTRSILQKYAEKHQHIKLIFLSDKEGESGKKAALGLATKIAKGELIVTTDADCIMKENWLSTIVSFYVHSNAKMIVAPVSFYEEKNSFEKMQSLEFMALMACGGASLYYNKAIMCNGANLAYSKRVFDEINGFENIDSKASGDDVLLMYKIKKKYPQGIRFLKHGDAIVYTHAKENVSSFIQQRKRWASKGLSSLNIETKIVSVIIYFLNFFLVFLPLSGLIYLSNNPFYPVFIEICLILIVIKCFIDFLLLFLSASFFNKRKLLLYFLPEQFIYMLYVVMIGLIGTLGKYEWKGRKIN